MSEDECCGATHYPCGRTSTSGAGRPELGRVAHLLIPLSSPGLLWSSQGALVRARGQDHVDRHLPMAPMRTQPAFAPPPRGTSVARTILGAR